MFCNLVTSDVIQSFAKLCNITQCFAVLRNVLQCYGMVCNIMQCSVLFCNSFPTCQVRVVRFYQWCLLLLLLPPCQLLIAVGTAGPQLAALDRNGHRRTGTASSRSQWAYLNLNGRCRIAVGIARPQPVKSRSQWALQYLRQNVRICVK